MTLSKESGRVRRMRSTSWRMGVVKEEWVLFGARGRIRRLRGGLS